MSAFANILCISLTLLTFHADKSQLTDEFSNRYIIEVTFETSHLDISANMLRYDIRLFISLIPEVSIQLRFGVEN